MKKGKSLENLRESSTADLFKKLEEARKSSANLRFEVSRGEIKNHRQIREKKRQVAQIMTEVRERAEKELEEKLIAEVSAPAEEIEAKPTKRRAKKETKRREPGSELK